MLIHNLSFIQISIFPPDNIYLIEHNIFLGIGKFHGKPVAALTIYKCLMRWKIFEAEKTSIFDRIVPVFGSAIEVT